MNDQQPNMRAYNMTHILRQILPNHNAVNKLHLAIENKTFLQRYINKTPDKLTLIDHYRHLRQLKLIYDTFTELLTRDDFTPKFPDELASLLKRGDNIQLDLDFLSPHIQHADKDAILPATKQYADHLRRIPLATGSASNNELLIHFLVSTLGDLNGGLFLKNFVRNMYKDRNLYSEDAPDNGVKFYSLDRSILNPLTSWLTTFLTFNEINESTEHDVEPPDESSRLLGKGAIDAFKMQAEIVENLESTRASSTAKNHFSLFNCTNTMKVAAGTAVAIGTALYLGLN